MSKIRIHFFQGRAWQVLGLILSAIRLIDCLTVHCTSTVCPQRLEVCFKCGLCYWKIILLARIETARDDSSNVLFFKHTRRKKIDFLNNVIQSRFFHELFLLKELLLSKTFLVKLFSEFGRTGSGQALRWSRGGKFAIENLNFKRRGVASS